jgi:hypothetical protein
MLFVGLVRGDEWGPPEDAPAGPGPVWHVPWQGLAWVATVFGLMFLGPVAGRAFGGLAGYAALLLAVGLGGWRIDRWCARQYWRALRDYQA